MAILDPRTGQKAVLPEDLVRVELFGIEIQLETDDLEAIKRGCNVPLGPPDAQGRVQALGYPHSIAADLRIALVIVAMRNGTQKMQEQIDTLTEKLNRLENTNVNAN